MSTPLSFKYIRGESLLHRLDVRAKIAFLLAWIASILLFYDARVLALLLAGGLLLLLTSGVPLREIARPLWILAGFVLINAVLTNLFVPSAAARFVPTQTEVFRLGFIHLYRETAFYTLVLTLRYLSIFPMAILFIITTDPAGLANAATKLGLPYRLAFVLNIAFRYLPTVAYEFSQIVDAQRARGLRLDDRRAGYAQRLRQLAAIIVPLLLSSLDRVESIANAMDLRCFGVDRRRTWYHDGALGFRDYALLAGSAALLGLAITAKFTVFRGFWLP